MYAFIAASVFVMFILIVLDDGLSSWLLISGTFCRMRSKSRWWIPDHSS